MTRAGGVWRPARLTVTDQQLLVWLSLAFIVLRAFDYLTGDDRPAPVPGKARPPATSLSLIENALPLWVWGSSLLAGAALVAAGMRARVHLAVWLGHTLIGIVGSALTVSVLLTALDKTWLDGIRSVGPLAFVTVFHWLLWARTGPVPLREADARITERTGEPR